MSSGKSVDSVEFCAEGRRRRDKDLLIFSGLPLGEMK